MTTGRVILVGAGPGDPGLLTIRARESIAAADVILYDGLVDDRVLRHARPEAKRVHVGKRGGPVARDEQQAVINDRLVAEARKGHCVVRLKGGDPFVFGRGGEEAAVLAEAGIPFEIVPGITSAIAVPAYAGIPVTHRGDCSSFTVVTGQEAPETRSRIDWPALAGTDTVVFLMALRPLREIARRLVDEGKPATTPAACISRGTSPRQKVVTGTLADIAGRVGNEPLERPTLLVVGDVVHLRERIAWFEKRPLFGRSIVVTRPRKQAAEFTGHLEALGAEVLEAPAIELVPREAGPELERALRGPRGFDWIVFTSASGVDIFFDALLDSGGDVRDLAGARVAAIGPATARALRRCGLRVDLVPEDHRAEGLRDELVPRAAGCRVLLPRASGARDVLPEALREAGADVTDLATYRAVTAQELPEIVRRRLREGSVDAVTFTSSSTVRSFLERVGPQERAGLERSRVACIGPVTAGTARDLGLRVDVVARTYTTEGLAEALIDTFGGGG